jgi:DNA-binding response OmpR family regulator
MSFEHPNILYIGDGEQGGALAQAVESLGWQVFTPATTLDALATYITLVPDIIMIDRVARPVFATEVYHHLRSIEARPLLLLTDPGSRVDWDRSDATVYVRRHTANHAELIEAVRSIVQREVAVTARRY